MTEDERRFADRVASLLIERGQGATAEAIEAAMRDLMRRDAEILDALSEERRLRAAGVPLLSDQARMGAAVRETIVAGIYAAVRS